MSNEMTLERASEIVLELARENVLDPSRLTVDDELLEAAADQQTAITMVYDFFVNKVWEWAGTEGQDRESYSDDPDRENYTIEDEQ